jgi:hypothetical protein
MILVNWESIDIYFEKHDQGLKIIFIPKSDLCAIEITIDFYWIIEIIYLSDIQVKNLYRLLYEKTQDMEIIKNKSDDEYRRLGFIDFTYEESVPKKYRLLRYQQIKAIDKTNLIVNSVLRPMKFDYNFNFLNYMRETYYHKYIDDNTSFSDYLLTNSNVFGLNRLEELIINSRWDVREQALKSSNFKEFINEWLLKFGIHENSILHLVYLFYDNTQIEVPKSPKTFILANYRSQNGMSRVNEFISRYLNSRTEEYQIINFWNIATDKVNINTNDRVIITLSPLDIEFYYRNMPWLFQTRIKIWYLIWELNVLPLGTNTILEDVNLIIVPSRFVYQSVPKYLQNKTTILPLKVDKYIDTPRIALRQKLKLNEKYLIISFDYDSDFERKNPELALEAFIKSEIYEDFGVKIKIIARHNSTSLNYLDKYKTHKGIEFVKNPLSNKEYHETLQSAIALMSTHRSEGYGLNLSEAMLLGTLVIATKYSGNMDFCDVENSLLIKNKIVQTKSFSHSVYSRIPNSYWAEPSLRSAVKKIRYIFSNTDECELLIEKAFKYAQENLTQEKLQLKLDRILEITQSRK